MYAPLTEDYWNSPCLEKDKFNRNSVPCIDIMMAKKIKRPLTFRVIVKERQNVVVAKKSSDSSGGSAQSKDG